jgi:hypothetical protein
MGKYLIKKIPDNVVQERDIMFYDFDKFEDYFKDEFEIKKNNTNSDGVHHQ